MMAKIVGQVEVMVAKADDELVEGIVVGFVDGGGEGEGLGEEVSGGGVLFDPEEKGGCDGGWEGVVEASRLVP